MHCQFSLLQMFDEFVKLTSAPELVVVTEVTREYNEFKSPLYSENSWEWVTVFTLPDHSADFIATTEEPEWEAGQKVLYKELWDFYKKYRSY